MNILVEDSMDNCESSQVFYQCFDNNEAVKDIRPKKYCEEDNAKFNEVNVYE